MNSDMTCPTRIHDQHDVDGNLTASLQHSESRRADTHQLLYTYHLRAAVKHKVCKAQSLVSILFVFRFLFL